VNKKELSKRYYNNEELTKEERDAIGVGDIRINAIQCKKCKETIQSEHRHDFKTCKCGSVSVDGGSWYCRRVGNLDDIIEKVITYKDVEEDEK